MPCSGRTLECIRKIPNHCNIGLLSIIQLFEIIKTKRKNVAIERHEFYLENITHLSEDLKNPGNMSVTASNSQSVAIQSISLTPEPSKKVLVPTTKE